MNIGDCINRPLITCRILPCTSIAIHPWRMPWPRPCFAIEEGNECLAVVVGDVGLGKTLTLRMIIDSLDPEKYKIALVTNPSISFTQLMQEMIGQLTGAQCLEKRKAQLLEIFNKTIFETSDTGKKVVLLIDEANAMPPASLENLRLLTNMQDDSRNLFTIVLAGQVELARKLEHPKKAEPLPADRDLQPDRKDPDRRAGEGLRGKTDRPGRRPAGPVPPRTPFPLSGTFRPRRAPLDQ